MAGDPDGMAISMATGSEASDMVRGLNMNVLVPAALAAMRMPYAAA